MLRSMVSPMFLAASLLLCVDASYYDMAEHNEEENNYDTAYMPYREKAAYGFIRNEYDGYYPDEMKMMVARFTDYPDGAFIAETKQCTVRWVTPHSYDTARQEWVNESRDGAIEIKLNDTVSADVARFTVEFANENYWGNISIIKTSRGGIDNRTITIPKELSRASDDSKRGAYDRLVITVAGEDEEELDVVHIPKGVPISRSGNMCRVTWESGPHSRIDIFVKKYLHGHYSRVLVAFVNGGIQVGEPVECRIIENSNGSKCRIERKYMSRVGDYDAIRVGLDDMTDYSEISLPKEVIEKAGR